MIRIHETRILPWLRSGAGSVPKQEVFDRCSSRFSLAGFPRCTGGSRDRDRRPVFAHPNDGFNTNTTLISVLLKASAQLSSPVDGNSYTGAVTFSSDSPHYISLKNNASGQQTVHYDYDMELILDDDTIETTKAGTNVSIALLAGETHTVPANLSQSVTVAAGSHTATAYSLVTSDGTSAGADHVHSFTR
jgi:hypothetical protein